jgi:hypothetical protein
MKQPNTARPLPIVLIRGTEVAACRGHWNPDTSGAFSFAFKVLFAGFGGSLSEPWLPLRAIRRQGADQLLLRSGAARPTVIARREDLSEQSHSGSAQLLFPTHLVRPGTTMKVNADASCRAGPGQRRATRLLTTARFIQRTPPNTQNSHASRAVGLFRPGSRPPAWRQLFQRVPTRSARQTQSVPSLARQAAGAALRTAQALEDRVRPTMVTADYVTRSTTTDPVKDPCRRAAPVVFLPQAFYPLPFGKAFMIPPLLGDNTAATI